MLKNVKFYKSHVIFDVVETKIVILGILSYILQSGT